MGVCQKSVINQREHLPEKTIKSFKINGYAHASRVGGNMKGTDATDTKTFRVSSGNIIYPSKLNAKTTDSGHGGFCRIEVVKSVEYSVPPAPGLPPEKRLFPTEIRMVTKAISPGCTVFNPKCIGRSSKRSCEFTGQYTD